MLTFCVLHRPGPTLRTGGLPWIAHVACSAHIYRSFQLTQVTILDLPVLRKQPPVHRSTATVNSGRTMWGCPWYASPVPHRSTGTHWWLVSKLRNNPPTSSDSYFPVRSGTHDIYLVNNTHMIMFSWICAQLRLNASASNISLEACPLGEEGRKFIIWLSPSPWSLLHWSCSLLYPFLVFHMVPDIE